MRKIREEIERYGQVCFKNKIKTANTLPKFSIIEDWCFLFYFILDASML